MGFDTIEINLGKIIFSDEEGGLTRSLTHGEIDLADLSGTLSRQRGIASWLQLPEATLVMEELKEEFNCFKNL